MEKTATLNLRVNPAVKKENIHSNSNDNSSGKNDKYI